MSPMRDPASHQVESAPFKDPTTTPQHPHTPPHDVKYASALKVILDRRGHSQALLCLAVCRSWSKREGLRTDLNSSTGGQMSEVRTITLSVAGCIVALALAFAAHNADLFPLLVMPACFILLSYTFKGIIFDNGFHPASKIVILSTGLFLVFIYVAIYVFPKIDYLSAIAPQWASSATSGEDRFLSLIALYFSIVSFKLSFHDEWSTRHQVRKSERK